jgi:hypothetical protein
VRPGIGFVAALLAAGAAGAALAKTEPIAPARPRSVLEGRPGFVPLMDPESSAVLLGRRTSAPAVQKRFRGGARSLDELGRTVVRLLHHAERDSLLALCVSQDEFSEILWHEFPQSRPATGLQWQDAWTILHARLRSGCGQALGDYGGTPYQFLRFEKLGRADSTFRYRNFTLHNGLFMVVRNPAGQIERWNWLRSVAERRGAFKIYSTTD